MRFVLQATAGQHCITQQKLVQQSSMDMAHAYPSSLECASVNVNAQEIPGPKSMPVQFSNFCSVPVIQFNVDEILSVIYAFVQHLQSA